MRSAREIKEQYGSICKETCEGYQDEHIIEAMEEYAKEGIINGTLLAGIKCAMEEHANNKNLKQSELIRKSFDLIGEIIDNCDADAIDLPPDLYDELKFHWKQLQKSI